MGAPFLYRAYVAATTALVPLAAYLETTKLRRAGLPAHRAHEKLGHATEDRRGTGPLVWFHAASVGESLSVLALISRMGVALPQARFLITSGTATSAQLIAARMPPNCVHQFAPLDAAGPVTRFLDHWRPDAAVFVESELWPQMLVRTRARGAHLALVNARLSAKSRAAWAKRPRTAAYVLGVFDLILTQNDAMAQAMVDLNAPADRVARGFNLKSLSDPLPVDPDAVAKSRKTLGHRPVWVASSTHPGEEKDVLEAHRSLLGTHPDLCLILAPRHPERGDEVEALIAQSGLSHTRRSTGGAPTQAVYLADTLGELGLWYALAPFVFLGGSLRPIGGHNPFEVTQSGAAVLSGTHVTNFAETFAAMEEAGAARMVADGPDLARLATAWLTDDAALARARRAARDFTRARTGQLDGIAARLIKALDLEQAA
ncbi:3-deoxy-D-manno-octulosonic acid transferase [Sulfitobacter sabulilitoris]|uniref:3-deoxy-D-manno-octulosonic acid transferase n=1 Tax=Sulfitobacter sabulilitoris TaxID=2562655 RepID=A0A5S3PN13_9RHOB|nr:3-deoxy-D-manno-octulosonic acid transferase [Sulfitobacter sabulilitoris]TMM54970.1 3-deoxy-D-manno-octulosonic acid transferase [Sulfitobacter sabulilitoris]